MLTVNQAVELTHGITLYHQHLRNADGSPLRAKVNGIPKILKIKSRRGEFSVPLKHGLYDHGYVDHTTAKNWCISEEDAMLHPLRKLGDWNLYVNKTGELPTEFYCSHCKKNCKTRCSNGGTGYAICDDNSLICYACATTLDKKKMIDIGKAYLYLSKNNQPHSNIYKVTNWVGMLEFQVPFYKFGKHNMSSGRTDVWFRGPDEFIWHGVQYGDNSQVVCCKRTKKTTW